MVMSIQVAVRVRPPLQTNQGIEDSCISVTPQTKQVMVANQTRFSADYVFSSKNGQAYVYDTCISQRVNYLLEGQDVSVIAYGKTNAGKTYSLAGPGLNCTLSEIHHGIIPRATRHIFNSLNRQQQLGGFQFKVYISFYEVANGEVHDLLSSQQKEFILAANDKGSTVINGVETVSCQNVNEVFNCLQTGMRYRQTAWTNHNLSSNQSHCFFVFTIHQHSILGGRLDKKISKGTFVDLGSSELLVFMGPHGQMMQQINNASPGLYALTSIISNLSNDRYISGQQNESLLVTLLKDCFMGSSHTLLLCCLTPTSVDYVETLTHLRLIDLVRSSYGYQPSEETGFDVNTTTSSQELLFENSDNGSVQADSFGLEFAASQWMKLVTNAEGLFNKLVQNGLSKDAKEQIDQWLCLKQECEECFANDSTVSLQGKTTRSLERIDEVTESEEKSSSEKSITESEVDSAEDDALELETLNEADVTGDTKRPDFAEKLEALIDEFRNCTDLEIDKLIHPVQQLPQTASPDKQTTVPKGFARATNNRRRKSILPGDIPIQLNEILEEGDTSKKEGDVKENSNEVVKEEESETINSSNKIMLENSSTQKLEDNKDLKLLSSESESKPSQIDMVILDLEGANKRIDELQQMIQIKLKDGNGGVDEERMKWIIEEEKRLMNLRESSQRLKQQLDEQQMMLEKRESFFKEKVCEEKNVNKSILETSTGITQFNQILKEKSSTLDLARNVETKEALRQEIRNLRKTRDCLVDERRNLDAKLNKEKVYTSLDERKFLEYDEAVEAIDAAIEYKNELICGRKGIESCDMKREKGEEMLMERLMKLSEAEMRTMLYKYFQKVIDLRESGRKMEQQITEQDQQIEAQTWKVQALSNALQQANIESERRLVMVHREHQEKLHLMFRHYAGETSGGSSVDPEGEKLSVQNKALKHRVLELEAMLYDHKGSVQHKSQSTSNALTIPQQNLKKLQGASSAGHTTKVTRQKNKLIIQQQKAKKSSK